MNQPPVQVSGDEVHAHVHGAGRSKLDLIFALLAIFISAVSLFVAIEHGKTERDLVAANSWPFLREILDSEYGTQNDAAIGVSNGGVGPAKLKSFEVFYDGLPVTSDLDLLRHCCGLKNETIKAQIPEGIVMSLVDETVLRPGEDSPVLRVHRLKSAPEVPDRFVASLQHMRITFRACYCSVLDECWRSDLRSTRTQPVRACPAPQHRFDPLGP
jgi:hypothetical protein